MNFGGIFHNRKNDGHSKNLEEIYKIKEEIDREDKIFEKELPAKYTLLQEFNQDQLKRLCNNVIGREPPLEKYDEQKSGEEATLPQFREDYIHFIIDELNMHEIKTFALENKIVSEGFFNT